MRWIIALAAVYAAFFSAMSAGSVVQRHRPGHAGRLFVERCDGH